MSGRRPGFSALEPARVAEPLFRLPALANLALGALAVVSLTTILFNVGFFTDLYVNQLEVKQDALPDVFNGTIEFPAVLGFTVNQKGIVQAVTEGILEGPNGTMLDPVLTYGPSNFPNAAIATPIGDSFVLNVTGGLALAGLRSRGVAGTYLRPLVSVTDDGVVSGITNGPPLAATDILFANSTVDDVLGDVAAAPILTYAPSALPAGKPIVPGGDSMQIAVGPAAVELRLQSRGTAGTYVRATLTVTDDGVISNISSGGMIQAGDVQYGMNTVGNVLGDILAAELIAYGTSALPSTKQIAAVGDSFFLNTTGPLVLAGLASRGVAGTYLRPLMSVTDDGVVSGIASGPPLTAAEILFSNTTAAAALESNIMVTQPSPNLPNSRVFTPNVNAFIYSVTSTESVLTLRPRPLIGASCAHPTLISYDAEFGLPESCTAGPAPGTPGGAATLDGSGKVLVSQLPDFLTALPLLGFWNAANNTPALFNSTCAATDTFYYIVSDSGNTTLGHHATWLEGDKAVCINGTWDQISHPLHPQTTFNGRSGNVLPQIGDYDASMITFGNYTLDALAGYGFVMWTASPGLPNGQLLIGDAGEIEVAGTSVGLAPKPNFPAPLTVFSGFIAYLEIDHFGRVETVATGNPLLNIFGTANQVLVSGTQNVTLSLPQDIHTGASPTFASMQVSTLVLNGKTVQSAGTGTVTIPNVGTADFVMTEGAQTVNGVKQMTSALVERGGVGLTLNNAANTFSTQILPASALGVNTQFRLPPTNGALGSVLETDGAGVTSWTASVVKTVTGTANRVIVGGTAQNPVLSTPQDIHTGASPTFASMQVSTIVLNGKTVQSSGTGTVTIPNVGTADFVMTAGAQTVGGAKSFSSTPVALGNVGVRLNNGANSFSTLVQADTGLAANTNFRTPPTSGTAGQVLTATGGGSTAWAAVPTATKDLQGAVLTATTTVTSKTFATMNGMSLTTANAATGRYKVWFTAKGSTSTSNVPIEARLLLNGTPVTNQLARYAQFEDEDSTMMLLGVVPSVAPGSTILVQVRVVTATTLTINYRSLMIEEA